MNVRYVPRSSNVPLAEFSESRQEPRVTELFGCLSGDNSSSNCSPRSSVRMPVCKLNEFRVIGPT